MIDTVSWWIKSDEKANWEKLAEALSKLESYGEKAENDVREKAGIGAKQKTCEYNLDQYKKFHVLAVTQDACRT